jgi:serine/threonine protein kinase
MIMLSDSATSTTSTYDTSLSAPLSKKEVAEIAQKTKALLIVLAMGYGILFLLSSALVIYMRINRNVALRGVSIAAKKILLPAFQPLLWVLVFVSFSYSGYFLIVAFGTVVDQPVTKLELEIYYAGRQFIMVIIIMYMRQKSVSAPALRRASLISVLLSLYNVPIVWYVHKYSTEESLYWIPTCTRMFLVSVYLWTFICPPARASTYVLREYCVFILIYYGLFITYNELFHRDRIDVGFVFAFVSIFWASLCPLVIWRVLKADTEHWRGLGQRAVALQSIFRQKHRLHERVSSKGLHVMIEMHRKYIIDFAYLDIKEQIGIGASASVFRGVLQNKTPVAVKVYTPSDVTEDTVAEFSHEAALCGALHHPNIVKFYGMCVCPPTICLVSELCQGNLEDITKSIARRKHASAGRQLVVNVGYMLDAARAVAYLHSFSPSFLHRDIKPSNFLVDSNYVVKLTDFGESRSLPFLQQNLASFNCKDFGREDIKKKKKLELMSIPLPVEHVQDNRAPSPKHSNKVDKLTVKGTVHYMAPELIRGRAGTALYGEAADVYSLAVTMWDILYPLEEKYPDTNNNHIKVFEAVLHGKRPPLNNSLHPALRRVIKESWDTAPGKRPSAQYIVEVLEGVQAELVSEIGSHLNSTMESKIVVKKGGFILDRSFTGHTLVHRMVELDYVDSSEQACRLGNALMDGGVMHHTKHASSFDNCGENYVFDENALRSFKQNFTQSDFGSAVSSLEHVSGSFSGAFTSFSDQEVLTVDDASSTCSSIVYLHPPTSKELEVCKCRKLGQGFDLSSTKGKHREFASAGDHGVKKKWTFNFDEHFLTSKLLTNEFEFGVDPFQGFDMTPNASITGASMSIRDEEIV